MRQRKPLSRSTPMPRGSTPLSRGPAKARRRDTGPTKAGRDVVKRRSGGLCERCGRLGEQIHHRKPRAMGGSTVVAINQAANLLHVCVLCHLDIESHRETAYAYGWLVPRSTDSALWAVLRYDGQWVLLTIDGGYVEAMAPNLDLGGDAA